MKQYQRRRRPKEPLAGSPEDSGLRFDESVPVQVIPVPNPAIEGRGEDEYEVVSEDVTYRLAQRPGSYVVLKYVRKTVKLKETRALVTSPAPSGVLGKSFADVSLLAGLLIDKFTYHLPLYRQHQRLQDCGIKLSRGTLTNLVQGTIALLEPIYFAVLSSILQSKVLLMDETPIKAGRASPGKLKQGYFWPIYGERFWRLPLAPEYKSAIKSTVADLKNVGKGRSGGAITAALFLQEFTDGVPWAHLDIAGPAFGDRDSDHLTKGAAGFAARTLLRYLLER